MAVRSSSTPVRVLVVDDNLLAAQAFERWFGTRSDFIFAGWAADAQSAVARAGDKAPDVVLLDLEMPGVDTLGLIPQLLVACPTVRIVMLSGYCRASDISRSLDAGAFGYITKDEPTSVIADLISRAAAGECVLSPSAERSFMAGA